MGTTLASLLERHSGGGGDYDDKLGHAFEELLLRFSVATAEEWH